MATSKAVDIETPAVMIPSSRDEVEQLRQRVAELERQLAAYQSLEAGSTNLTTTNEDAATAEKSFRFLDLPRELRDAIYKDCMVVDKVYISHPFTVWTSDMRINGTAAPEYQLFRVNKQIHDEAKEGFMLGNLFVLTAGPCTALPALGKFLDSVDTKKIRRMSTSFDYRDYPTAGVDQTFAKRISTWRPHIGRLIDETQLDVLDKTAYSMAEDLWYTLLTKLYCLRLSYLQLNLQNCHDSIGVERIVEKAFHAACTRSDMHGLSAAGFMYETNICTTLVEMRPEVLDIVGTVNEVEREWLRGELAVLAPRLQFHGGYNSEANAKLIGDWDENEVLCEAEESEGNGEDKSDSEDDTGVDG